MTGLTVRRRPADPAEVAALSRRAHRQPDFGAGLPVADAVHDTARDVAAALATGAEVWTGWSDGRLVCAARVVAGADRSWLIKRVSVDPTVRRAGLARRLLAAIDAAAHRDRVAELRLDAVVERRLATVYGRLGFRVRSRSASPDKALTEAAMYRPVNAAPACYAGPLAGDDSVPPLGLVVVWITGPTGCYALCAGDGHPRRAVAWARRYGTVVGVDIWPYGRPALRRRIARHLLARGAARDLRAVRPGLLLRLSGRPATVPAYRMPRRVHPSLLAWWRPITDSPGEPNHV